MQVSLGTPGGVVVFRVTKVGRFTLLKVINSEYF